MDVEEHRQGAYVIHEETGDYSYIEMPETSSQFVDALKRACELTIKAMTSMRKRNKDEDYG